MLKPLVTGQRRDARQPATDAGKAAHLVPAAAAGGMGIAVKADIGEAGLRAEAEWAAVIRRELLAGNYTAACDALLDYRKLTSARQEGPGWVVSKRDVQGRPTRWEFDCSTPGNKVCRGVWTRQQARYAACMEAQQ